MCPLLARVQRRQPLLLCLFLLALAALPAAATAEETSATAHAYPRPSESGARLLEWLRENGGVAHAEVIEIAPGHRILVTDDQVPPQHDIVVVPPDLSIQPHSARVQELWLVQEAQKSGRYDETWALQTFVMWASLPNTHTEFDPYFDSLPRWEDYRHHCHWTDSELPQLHMQPYEPGMPKAKSSSDAMPFPTPSSPGLTWDNDFEWEQWHQKTKTILRVAGKRMSVDNLWVEDRQLFAWANMVIKSREWTGLGLWPVLDMADSNLMSDAKFLVEVGVHKSGKIRSSNQPTPKGTELFTVPSAVPNVAFLRNSCHAFENNPYEFVMLDFQLPESLTDNEQGMQSLQTLLLDARPYDDPNPMDTPYQKNARINVYMAGSDTGNNLRATVRLLPQSITALMSLARASVSPTDLVDMGRQELQGRNELLALDRAERWLTARQAQDPTTLAYDQELQKELAQAQALDRQGRVEEASVLASSGKLASMGPEWDSPAKREKLHTALVFRTQQKSIVEANLSTIRYHKYQRALLKTEL